MTIFEKIIAREIPAAIIYEDDICIAFMDAFPNTKGQSLIIPKKPIDYLFDADDETYTYLFKVAKKIALATDAALETERTCIVVEGFEVPHAHIKLFPVYERSLNITSGESEDIDTLEKTAQQIIEQLDNMK